MQSARGVPAGDTGLFCARTGALLSDENIDGIRNLVIATKERIPSSFRNAGGAMMNGAIRPLVELHNGWENSTTRFVLNKRMGDAQHTAARTLFEGAVDMFEKRVQKSRDARTFHVP